MKKDGLNESNLDQIKCSASDNKRLSEWSCNKCDERICDLCYKAHVWVKLTKNHTLSKL